MTKRLTKSRTSEALRMVGHLLEHHGTTRAMAKDKEGIPLMSLNSTACCWCLYGAVDAVSQRLHLCPFAVRERIKATLELRHVGVIGAWDHAPGGQRGRKAIIDKLKSA